MSRNKRLEKIHKQCRTWIRRFVDAVAKEHIGIASSSHAPYCCSAEDDVTRHAPDVADRLLRNMREHGDGFVVLNGGLASGCSPYTLRCYLIEAGVIERQGTDELAGNGTLAPAPCMHVGLTLPFAIVTRPLPTCTNKTIPCAEVAASESTVSHSAAPASSPVATALTEHDVLYRMVFDITQLQGKQRDKSYELLAHDANGADGNHCLSLCAGDCQTIVAYAMQLSPGRGVHQGGSSTKAGSDLLFFVACDVQYIVPVLQPRLQQPVLGIGTLVQDMYHHKVDHIAQREPEQSPSFVQKESRRERSRKAAQPVRECRALPCEAFARVPGLYCVRDFVTVEEEEDVLLELDEQRMVSRVEHLAHRRVAHFSYRFLYGTNQLAHMPDKANDNPRFFAWMQRRLANVDPCVSIASPYPVPRAVCSTPVDPDDAHSVQSSSNTDARDAVSNESQSTNSHRARAMFDTRALCDQLTINYYSYDRQHGGGGKASGIAAHVDAHSPFGELVFIVSLGSHSVMEFTRFDQPVSRVAPQLLYLAPRSVVVLSGEARYAWRHGIAERWSDHLSELLPSRMRGRRVSLTWRHHRQGAHEKSTCTCPALCDGAVGTALP